MYIHVHDLSAQCSVDTDVHVATISQLRTCVMKIEHSQAKLSDVTTIRDFSIRKEFVPSGSKLFPLRDAYILKRDAIDDLQDLHLQRKVT